MRVAFLGLGRMGSAMARHVLERGDQLVVWNRSPGKAGDLTAAGATEAGSVAEAVRDAEVVVLMLFGPDSDREVLAAVADAAGTGTLVIDSTTIGPAAAREMGALAAGKGLRYVDAPVVGTVTPARQGTLGVLAGGSEADVEAARPLLEAWGDAERVRRVGEVGAGSALKSVVNLCLGVAMAGVGEAMRLGADLGLDAGVVLGALEQGPFGFSVKQKRQMLESGDYSETAFSLELLAKDLALAVSSAAAELPVTAAASDEAAAASAAGRGGDDYASLAGYLAGQGG